MRVTAGDAPRRGREVTLREIVTLSPRRVLCHKAELRGTPRSVVARLLCGDLLLYHRAVFYVTRLSCGGRRGTPRSVVARLLCGKLLLYYRAVFYVTRLSCGFCGQ